MGTSPRPLDLEILRFVTRFGVTRAWHVAAWTGAGAWTVEERLRELRRAGLLSVMDAPADLWDATQGVTRPTLVPVWVPTARGARLAGPVTVPGTNRVVAPRTTRPSPPTAVQTIPMVDLAVWYRAFGYGVVAPRELRSTELRPAYRRDHPVEGTWATTATTLDGLLEGGGRHAVHLPTLGVIHPSGALWAVELETAPRKVSTYRQIIGSTRAAGLGLVWHTASQTAGRRILRAGTLAGLRWVPHPTRRGVTMTPDGLVRVQGWRHGPVGLDAPPTWRGLLHG